MLFNTLASTFIWVIMFTNNEISIENLPRVDAINFTVLDPKLKTRGLINRGIFSIVLIIFSIILYIMTPFTVFISITSGLVLLIVLNMIWPRISYPKKMVALRDHDILYKHGVVWKSFKAVPFNRLQHIEITRSPVDRFLGLATLVFYTAGGSLGDLKINGLTSAYAEQLREHILQIINKDDHDQSE